MIKILSLIAKAKIFNLFEFAKICLLFLFYLKKKLKNLFIIKKYNISNSILKF